MAFKTDTIRLKNFANDGAVTGESQGELAVVSNAVSYTHLTLPTILLV